MTLPWNPIDEQCIALLRARARRESRWPAAPARSTRASICVALFAFANGLVVLVALTALCFAFQRADASPYRHADESAGVLTSNPGDIDGESSRDGGVR